MKSAAKRARLQRVEERIEELKQELGEVRALERLRDNPHLSDEQRAAVEESVNRQLEAKPVPPHMVRQPHTTDDAEAWKGTPPAEGTRRALIRDTIERTFAGKDFPTDLDLADAVEAALLKIDIGADPTGEVSPASTAMDVLDQFAIPRTREGAILDIGQRVTELADKFVEGRRNAAECYRLTGADPFDGSDAMLAREAIDEVRRFRAEYDELEEAIGKVGDALDRIDAPQGSTCAERIDRLYSEMREKIDAAYVERQHALVSKLRRRGEVKRERLAEDEFSREARAGEDHFKAQRDSALDLVRRLIGEVL